MTFRRCVLRAAIAAAIALESGVAEAGGFELPDNGTQALGRGAAFVAKASDATAIYHNPAGLARQRGTHLLANGNLYIHSFEFQRIGTFPDDPQDAQTPWGDTPYPRVKNIASPFISPFLALTTDFGYFDRITFAAGIFGPPSVANRTFPLSIGGKPSASRYDFVQSRSSLLYPTVAAAVRVTRWLDIGVSGHLVLASFDQTMLSYSDLETCSENTIDGQKRREDFRCDTESRLKAKGTSFAATIGATVRPVRWLAFGASFRTPTNVSANGTLTPEPPSALPAGQELTAGPANLAFQLPWAARFGVRYIGMDADFEVYDLELDGTYEGWGSAQGLGPILTVPDIGSFKDIQTVITRGYKNTIGVRAGGAYNIDTGAGVLTLRGGSYFDSSATDFATTRLDYDTLAKVAGTLGLGYKIGSFGFDVAYAAVASIPRTVGTGAGKVRPINLVDGGSSSDRDGNPLPAVNEGSYRGFTHIVSFGLGVSIDGLFGPPRKFHYGNAYEPNYVGAGDERPDAKPVDEKKLEEKKPEEKPAEKPPEEKPPEEKKPEEKKPEEKKPVAEAPPEKPEPKKPEPKAPPAPPVVVPAPPV
ncbi:MAG TPA: outer membrane protein transport protein, partial [Labilithrix sp.]|nr:outer membrane protein transport protein [Labilithrix sp.]